MVEGEGGAAEPEVAEEAEGQIESPPGGEAPAADPGQVAQPVQPPPANLTPVEQAVDRSAGRAAVVFLVALLLILVVLLGGAALEVLFYPVSEDKKQIFNLLIEVAHASGGNWTIVLEAVLAVLAVYLVSGLSVRSWNIMAYLALAAMLGAAVVWIKSQSGSFGASICAFPFVAGEKEAQEAFSIACGKWEGGVAIWKNLLSFSGSAIAANFVIFLALLKRDAANEKLRQLLKKFGLGGE